MKYIFLILARVEKVLAYAKSKLHMRCRKIFLEQGYVQKKIILVAKTLSSILAVTELFLA